MEPIRPHIRFFDEVSSTNALLMEAVLEGAKVGTVYIANRQTSGRGRMNRSFFSPTGGVFISILLPFEKEECVTAMAGAAVCGAIIDYCGKECEIKWINDILIGEKKVCGILAQTAKDQNDNMYVVLGIGINYQVKQQEFPEDLKNIATSIFNESEEPVIAKKEFALNVVKRILKLYEEGRDSWLDFYRKHSAVIGRTVLVSPLGVGGYDADVKSIDSNCHLHVITKDGLEKILSSGEITLRIKRN